MRRTTAAFRDHRHLGASHAIILKPEVQWVIIGLFVIVIALLGGSSRPDPIQNAILRPIIALSFIPLLCYLRTADLSPVRWLATLLSLMTAWMAIQLVPLPPELWEKLPGRAVIAQLDELTGLAGTWRPISLSPFRGINSLLGMVVPLGSLLFATLIKMRTRQVLFSIIAIGIIDAIFGILQVTGGTQSPFYLFAITHRGAPAGVFANENHSAVFSALVLLSIARLGIDGAYRSDPTWLKVALAAAFTFILLDALVTGSRAGLAATFAALVGVIAMALLKNRKPSQSPKGPKGEGHVQAWAGRVTLAFAVVVALLVAGFVWLGRAPALTDILAKDSFDDLRWSLWPLLLDMATTHWLIGTGFGSFDAVYRIYEPTELLFPVYVNHAHNDWIQLVIEGGVPSIVIFLVGLGWLGKTAWVVLCRPEGASVHLVFWVAWVVIVGAASIVDYPLRTPIFQCVVIWLLASLAFKRASMERSALSS